MTWGEAGPRIRRGLLSFLLLALPACAGLHSIELGRDGESLRDRELRDLLARGRFGAALSRLEPDAGHAGDELLRLLESGLVAHYARELEASNDSFERALLLIEDRYTKSLTRAIVSLVTSDRLLAWTPNRTERSLVHYYAGLNYLALGQPDEAAVEARRLAHVLSLSEEDAPGGAERDLRRVLRYFTGAMFEAAGETEDAAVAFRLASVDAETSMTPRAVSPLAPSGEVVLFLESGFVAHRVEQSINVLLYPEEVAAFGHERAQIRYAAARCVARRAFGDVPPSVFAVLGATATWHLGAGDRCLVEGVAPVRKHEQEHASRNGDGEDEDDDHVAIPRFLRIAWPALRRTGTAAHVVAVRSDVGETASPVLDTDVTASVTQEFDAGLGGVLVKALARAATKYAAVEGIEEGFGGSDEVLGRLAGLAANAAGALLERADLRSWHLVPARLDVVRLRLPPGRHSLTAILSAGRELRLPDVQVRAGETTVTAARLWPGSVGSLTEAR
ncbi:MAG: hypothetical protein ACE5HF_02650 [Gemmatimonadota bacterium]